jgi:acyl carrier protein
MPAAAAAGQVESEQPQSQPAPSVPAAVSGEAAIRRPVETSTPAQLAPPPNSGPAAGAAPEDFGVPAEIPSSTAAPASLDAKQLEVFLVNFVVEQTGYPPEIVELDADLEADLGIDSIKKAQLFGELGEYFDVTPDENLTLDDFPTLRHVQQFLAQASAGGDSPVVVQKPLPAVPGAGDLSPVEDPIPTLPPTATSPMAPPRSFDEIPSSPAEPASSLSEPSKVRAEPQPSLVEPPGDLAAPPQPFAELPSVLPEPPNQLTKTSNSLTAPPSSLAEPSSSLSESATLDPGQLEVFLVTFVVEQTGYPPEIVELDADLEADLGIDSIKKAQLFGELGEYFEVTPDENLTLDDFPTLRHVMEYLQQHGLPVGGQ